jgi:hypothetical protein
MSQYDAAATPLWNCFSKVCDTSAFLARPAGVDINIRNEATNHSAALSRHFNLSHPDKVPDALLSQVVWKSVKGEASPVPEPRRSAFVIVSSDPD